MPNATVYFATNRVAQGPATDWRSYRAEIVTPTDPSRITYAAAFVEGTDLAAEGSGTIAHDASDRHHDATLLSGPEWVPSPVALTCR